MTTIPKIYFVINNSIFYTNSMLAKKCFKLMSLYTLICFHFVSLQQLLYTRVPLNWTTLLLLPLESQKRNINKYSYGYLNIRKNVTKHKEGELVH